MNWGSNYQEILKSAQDQIMFSRDYTEKKAKKYCNVPRAEYVGKHLSEIYAVVRGKKQTYMAEIIREGPCRGYADLEHDRDPVGESASDQAIVHEYIKRYYEFLALKCPNREFERDAIILWSNTKDKFSAHIHFPSVIFANNFSQQKSFTQHFYMWLKNQDRAVAR